MIATAAAAALALDPTPHQSTRGAAGGAAAHVRRLRARRARDVAVMLSVPAARVVVTDDPLAATAGTPGT